MRDCTFCSIHYNSRISHDRIGCDNNSKLEIPFISISCNYCKEINKFHLVFFLPRAPYSTPHTSFSRIRFISPLLILLLLGWCSWSCLWSFQVVHPSIHSISFLCSARFLIFPATTTYFYSHFTFSQNISLSCPPSREDHPHCSLMKNLWHNYTNSAI